ncbi:MAG TPA: glycosyltransferase family 2 protein [Chthoniobacterales bacterium]|nr:glycosyltransferase family 2 protein [Chthoniobacterales bacterium]
MNSGLDNPPEISVVIPVFNESQNLGPLLAALDTVLGAADRSFEVIFVNDGSSDSTADRLDQIADNRVRVVHFGRNFGQTAALMAGFNHARGQVIVAMDGDMQNDPADIPKLLAKLDEGFDVVSGWRANRKDAALSRTLPSKVANWLIATLSGVPLHDFGCTLKAYRRAALREVRLYGEMHRFIPIYAAWNGGKVAEVPVTHHPRRHGKSNYGLERLVKVVLDLIVLAFLYRYLQKPMYLFGSTGLISFLISGISGAASIYFKYWGGKSFIETPLPTLFAIAFITGCMCFLMGLLAELITRTYHESQRKETYLVSRTRNIAPVPGVDRLLSPLDVSVGDLSLGAGPVRTVRATEPIRMARPSEHDHIRGGITDAKCAASPAS